MARPSKYNEETIKISKHYLDNYESYGDHIPMICGLAVVLGITRETVYKWSLSPDKKEFSYIVKEIMTAQEKTLINKGLTGDFNSTITKLALAKHGYHDKQDVDHSGSIDLSGKSDEELQKIIDG